MILTGLFGVIFKVLPDAVITWKDAMIGASLTAVLFLIGKIIIGYYLKRLNLDITYGTAASIIIILSWVYYSAIILFLEQSLQKCLPCKPGQVSGLKTQQFLLLKENPKKFRILIWIHEVV